MTVYISTVIVEADEVSHLSQMAEFYKMPVQNLLSDAMAGAMIEIG